MTGNADLGGTVRQGRCARQRIAAEIASRSEVVPGAPMIGISCFATAAPPWNDTIATIRLTTAVSMRSLYARAARRSIACERGVADGSRLNGRTAWAGRTGVEIIGDYMCGSLR